MENKKNFQLTDYEFVGEHRVLMEKTKGWKLELNKVIWRKGSEPKYDIRAWSADHKMMGKGISLTKAETVRLRDTLNEMDELKYADDVEEEDINF